MGSENDRIKSYARRYYARAEGRERAKLRRANQKGADMALIILMIIGVFIVALSPTFWGKVFGVGMIVISIFLLVLSIIAYRRR